jgi:4-diphosphocytidyl-2-C-methyl-D-erythritol kinase
MPVFTELARAKVNLTLEVLGRRPDGYHELASLVAFADVGDVITLDTDAAVGVTVSGPFAQALVGENLIATTLRRLSEAHPALKLGAVHLDKRLPVAAGIGGGSADAAAVLRAVRRANPSAAGDVPWQRIAASLGADVPVCLAQTTAWMTGIGDQLQKVPGLPGLSAVLVNALGPVPSDKTARVFRALNAKPVGPRSDSDTTPAVPSFPATDRPDQARAALLDFMRERGNSLQPATLQVVPDVAIVLAALGLLEAQWTLNEGPLFAAMSGAGPTCFAVFATGASASAAADLITRKHPQWWVAATRIG